MTQAQYPQGVQGKVTVQNEMNAKNMKISTRNRTLQSDDVVTLQDLVTLGVTTGTGVSSVGSGATGGAGGGAVPITPGSGIAATVLASLDPYQYYLQITWTPIASFDGAVQYELEGKFWDSLTSGTAIIDSWISIGLVTDLSVSDVKFGPFPRNIIDMYEEVRIRLSDGVGNFSDWATSAARVLIDKAPGPAPASSITLALDTSLPDGYRLDVTWAMPSPLLSISATQRKAVFFADGTTTTVEYETLLDGLNFDLAAASSVHGPFDYQTSDAYIEVWVGTVDFNNQVTWAPSNRVTLTGGLGPVTSAGDVIIDDSYIQKAWAYDQLKLTSRYAPYYPSGASYVTPTLAAHVYAELPNVAVLDGGVVPYTKVSSDTPPANLQNFTISIPKQDIIDLTPDGSGDRHLWLHACNIQDTGDGSSKEIPYKTYTIQGSQATAEVIIASTELDANTGGITQPVDSDITLTILEYANNLSLGRMVHIQIDVPVPADATYINLFKAIKPYGDATPPNIDEWQLFLTSYGTIDYWEVQQELGERLWIAATAGDNGWGNSPTATTAKAYIDVNSWGEPAQLTSCSIVIEGPTLQGATKKGRIKYIWTAPPSSDPNFWYAGVELNWTDSSWTEIEPYQRELGQKGYGSQVGYSGWWDWPADDQYRQAKFFSVDLFEVERKHDAIIVNLHVVANAELIDLSKADTTTYDGFTISGGKLTLNLDSADFVVTGGKLTAYGVNAAKLYNLGSEFATGTGLLVVNAIAVNKLLAGTALFTGAVAFTNSTSGASMGISSSGVAITDGGTKLVTLDSSGAVISNGSNNVTIGSSSIVVSAGGGSLTVSSGGVSAAYIGAATIVATSALTMDDLTTTYFAASPSAVYARNFSVTSWSNVTTTLNQLLPSQTGHGGQFLSTDGGGTVSWQSGSGGAVSSVFGRTGAVVAASGDYSAAQISGLGGAAVLNVGTSAGTVAAGDHNHDTVYAPLIYTSTITVNDELYYLDTNKITKTSAAGTFTSADGKTITVADGAITSIV